MCLYIYVDFLYSGQGEKVLNLNLNPFCPFPTLCLFEMVIYIAWHNCDIQLLVINTPRDCRCTSSYELVSLLWQYTGK